MKKSFLNKWVIFIPLFAAVCFSSCKKEDTPDPVIQVVDQPFTMTSDTHPRINPFAAKQLEEQPSMYGYANAAGGGTGDATDRGAIRKALYPSFSKMILTNFVKLMTGLKFLYQSTAV